MTPVYRYMMICVLLTYAIAGRPAASEQPLLVTRQETRVPAARLFVSNMPERVSAPRILFEGRLRDDSAVRMVYHHLNDGSGALRFSIELLNPSAAPVQVQVIEAFAAPQASELTVGHLATLRYAEREGSNTGHALTVPADSALTIHTERWPAGTVVSGLARFRMLHAGGTAILRLRAHAQESARIAALTDYTPSAVMGDYAFISTALFFTGSYAVDGMWLFHSLGDVSIPGESPSQYLAGAYGVWHHYTMTLSNPTARQATVLLSITAGGGVGRLVYSFGEGWKETRLLQPDKEETLASFTLAPGARRTVRLTAMPQSGSNYPMRLTVRPK